MFQSIYTTTVTNIQKSLEKGSGWIIASVIDTKLPKEWDHPRKRLINIQNIDDKECFKWSLVRYLSPADHYPRRIIKAEKDFAKKLDFKGIKFPVKIRDLSNFKNNSIGISVFA